MSRKAIIEQERINVLPHTPKATKWQKLPLNANTEY
jgi:hypothetical protein